MLKLIDSPPQSRRRFHNCRLLAGHRVSQKYKRAQLRKLQRREYRNLKKLIPEIKDQQNVNKTTVVNEAIKYIDELHSALFHRFARGTLPKHVLPEAMPIIQLLQNGQLPLPPALQPFQEMFLQQRLQQQQNLQQPPLCQQLNSRHSSQQPHLQQQQLPMQHQQLPIHQQQLPMQQHHLPMQQPYLQQQLQPSLGQTRRPLQSIGNLPQRK